MSFSRKYRSVAVTLSAVAAATVVACSDHTEPTAPRIPAKANRVVTPAVEPGVAKICKQGSGSGSFSWTYVTSFAPFPLMGVEIVAAGECVAIPLTVSGTMTVIETPIAPSVFKSIVVSVFGSASASAISAERKGIVTGLGPSTGATFAFTNESITDPQIGRLKVCKVGEGLGTFVADFGGPTATFNTAPGGCTVILLDASLENVTVTETGVAAGYEFKSVAATGIGDYTASTDQAKKQAHVHVNFTSGGATVTFTNGPIVYPPAGCSAGYFKTHQVQFSDQAFNAFGIFDTGHPLSLTLAQALSLKGGSTLQGAKDLLLRQAAAAFLNMHHVPGYPLNLSGILEKVKPALSSGNRATILAVQKQLEAFNNLGCPLK